MARVKVIFYKGEGDFFDKLIRLWTLSKYSHSEIIIDNYRATSLPNIGVVRINKSLYSDEVWDTLEFDITEEQAVRAKEFIKSQLGKEYDWKAIFLTFIFPFKSQNPDKWFCSEFVAKVINVMQLPFIKFPKVSKVSPSTLFNELRKVI